MINEKNSNIHLFIDRYIFENDNYKYAFFVIFENDYFC